MECQHENDIICRKVFGNFWYEVYCGKCYKFLYMIKEQKNANSK